MTELPVALSPSIPHPDNPITSNPDATKYATLMLLGRDTWHHGFSNPPGSGCEGRRGLALPAGFLARGGATVFCLRTRRGGAGGSGAFPLRPLDSPFYPFFFF